ncbi:MAG TPA: FUSC family protein [Methylocella sp.]|nr:FUSC family protein [Methylocella sp.]
MTSAIGDQPGFRRASGRWARALARMFRVAGQPLLFGLRLWASVCLALYIAFWLELDNEFWAGLTAAITCQPQLGASLRKGWYRMVGTLVGAILIVALTGLFPQQRAPFLLALASWAAACAMAATLLRNFASYAAALAGYTAVVIAGDELGATGGPNVNEVFLLAVTRASEICIGIVSAGIVLAGTDFGGVRRRLAGSFAALSAEITGRFTGMLALAGPELAETTPIRRELVRRVIGLDPIIDQAKGESSQIRHHSPILQMAVDGLFAAVVGWRVIAVHLARVPDGEAQLEAGAVLQCIPQELRQAEYGVPAAWLTNPADQSEMCDAAARVLTTMPANTPSLRLLTDQTAKVLTGISSALDGLALLLLNPIRQLPWHPNVQVRVPDWLPSLVNAGRAFVTIGAVMIFWILTQWPNGATAITFTAIAVLLFAPRVDQAYQAAMEFAAGTALGTVFSAIIKFAVLPGIETFEGFCLVIGLFLIPAGALIAQPRHTAMFTSMTVYFCALVQPANEMSFDTAQFYNNALAIVTGLAVAAFSFRMLPPLSPVFRTSRLLALTLRDLRRLAAGRVLWTSGNWESLLFGRLEALPDTAEPLQRSQLVTALSVGNGIIELRHIVSRLDLSEDLDAALAALARGNGGIAVTRLTSLDGRLAAFSAGRSGPLLALQARSIILTISEALREHAAYFESGEPL